MSQNQENRYPYVAYSNYETTPGDTPQGEKSEKPQEPKAQQPPINVVQPELQSFAQPQFIPVQGPNGIFYIPAGQQFPGFQQQMGMPVQGQVVNNFPMGNIPQGQVLYGYPMAGQPQYPQFAQPSAEWDCFGYKKLNDAEKFSVQLKIFAVLSAFLMLSGGYSFIASALLLASCIKGTVAIRQMKLRSFRFFLKMTGLTFIISAYSGFLIMFGAPLYGFLTYLILTIISGFIVKRGRCLMKKQFSSEWANLEVNLNQNNGCGSGCHC